MCSRNVQVHTLLARQELRSAAADELSERSKPFCAEDIVCTRMVSAVLLDETRAIELEIDEALNLHTLCFAEHRSSLPG